MTRPSTAAPILAVLAVVLVTLGAYVGGYYGLGQYSEGWFFAGADAPPQTYRVYSDLRLTQAFVPLAWIESRLTRRQVSLWWKSPEMYSLIFSTDEDAELTP